METTKDNVTTKALEERDSDELELARYRQERRQKAYDQRIESLQQVKDAGLLSERQVLELKRLRACPRRPAHDIDQTYAPSGAVMSVIAFLFLALALIGRVDGGVLIILGLVGVGAVTVATYLLDARRQTRRNEADLALLRDVGVEGWS